MRRFMPSVVIVGVDTDPQGVVKSPCLSCGATGVGVRVQIRKSFGGNTPTAKEVWKTWASEALVPAQAADRKKP